MGLCIRSMCHSTIPAWKLTANDSDEAMTTELQNLNLLQISCLQRDARSFLKALSEAKKQFLN